MKLPELAIKNQQFVYVLVILALFIGIRSFISMPKAEDPFLSLPNYTIIAVYPGTSPEDMEELVADPLEEVIDELDEITEIRTEISNGLVVIQVQAEFGIDYNEKYDDILNEVNIIRNELPENLYSLEVNQFKPEERVVIQQFALVSETATFQQLHDVAEDFEEKLEQLDFVKKTEVEAYPVEEIRVSVDFQKMAQLSIPLRQVLGVLQGDNANIPGGDISSGNLSFSIQSTGGYESLEDISNTAVRSSNNQIVYLRDFAEVTHEYEDERWAARFNGQRCIYVNVFQKRSTSILALSNELNAAAESFQETLPAEVQLATAFEQAPAVEARISDFVNNLLQGIVLVGVIIALFLGWRPALVVMTVIPLSIILAITTLDFTNYALQQISIAALVIALGLLVDNAIVVIENIVRFRRDGYSLLEAAAKGTQEVGYAIVSSTLTTVLAFAPLSLLSSGPGEFLRTLPLTVIFALLASLVLALAFTPIITSQVLSSKSIGKGTWISHQIDHFVSRFYRPAVNFALRRGWVPVVVGVLMLAGAGALFPSIGVSFFPTADKSLLLVSVDLPYSANLERTEQAVRYVEEVLDTTEYIKNYTVNVGHGNPQVYYNRIPEEYKKYHGEVVINFKEWEPAKFYATLGQLRNAFAQYSDARITFRELKNGAPFEAPVEILLLGDNLDTLQRIGYDIEKVIRSAPGTQDVDNPMALAKTDVKVAVNRDKASLYNISLLDLDQTVRASLNGIQVDEVVLEEDDETYPLVVRIPFADEPTLDDFGRVYLSRDDGQSVPLRQVADVEFKAEYAKISHFNTTRSLGITANVDDPDRTKDITESIIPALDSYDWPEGYSYYIGGEYETQQESFGDLGILLAVAMLGIFAILVLQFRSLVQPLIIFSAIPLAVTGSFVALFITSWSFSFFAFVGFISLVGIVVNNSIILVDYTNQLMREGLDKATAIRQASERRFTPIVLTTLTTILGLIPLTVSGTSLWSPLGWTLIGGLVSSMLLTLIIVPVLYNWFTKENKTEPIAQ
ncbi:MAG: efflux RND transporter permease subunit [Tunicatimonas sp.]|uniref:efflux RND transporter permease subunit n=1 Tax=Tunicatimonas sp. TaxID=1940096 RepID=UPI003C781771